MNKTLLQITKNHRDSDVLSIQKEHLFSGYHARLLLILTLGAALAKFSKLVLPPLLPVITTDLSITPAIAGGALSLLTLTSAFLQYPGGKLSDHLSKKTVLVLSYFFLIAGCILLLSIPTLGAFIIGIMIIGACDGLFHIPARALLSDLYVAKRGKALGLHLIAIDIAGILAAIVAIVAVATWRIVFIPVLFSAIGVLVLYHFTSRGNYVVHTVPLEITSTLKRILRSKPLRQLIIVNAMFSFVFQGFIGFLPLFIQTYHGLSLSFAAGAFALLFIIGIFIKPISGDLSDKFGGKTITLISLSFISTGIIFLLVFSNPVLLIAGVVLVALGQKSFTPPMQMMLLDTVSQKNIAGDFGAARTIFFGIGSMGPLYLGITASTFGYFSAFSGYIVCMLFAILILFKFQLK